MKWLLALLLLLAAASALELNVTKPIGVYSAGSIPVEATLKDSGLVITNATVTAALKDSRGLTLETKGLAYSSSTQSYAGFFTVEKKGDYTAGVTAAYSGATLTESNVFSVNTSKITMNVLSPVNKTYDTGSVLIEVELFSENLFVHGATVTARAGGKSFAVPEGQNSYRLEASFDPGFYAMTIDAVKGAEKATSEVSFSVAGAVVSDGQTVYIPGPKGMGIQKVAPTRGQYTPGEESQIAVFVVDFKGQRVKDASVTAFIRTPTKNYTLPLLLESESFPRYFADVTFSEEGWWEITVTAKKPGFFDAVTRYGLINVGTAKPQLPKTAVCAQGLCIDILSPAGDVTYPVGQTVELRGQVFDQTTVTPLSDASVSVDIGGTVYGLVYDWNGMYANFTEPLGQGDYVASFTATRGPAAVTANKTFTVSPNTLSVSPINPLPDSNVTGSVATFQLKVTDQNGDIVVDANVRIVLSTPTAVHTVTLLRNVTSGYYESPYTFSDAGEHTAKVVASKRGYVSGETSFDFEVVFEKPQFQLTERDVVLLAVIAGVIIVIATLWKALL
jgi:nitrogen fixation protein FixH